MVEDAPAVVADRVIEDLRGRLRAFRPVAVSADLGPGHGIDPAYLSELLAYWAGGYDWRPHEDRIRRLPWTLAGQTPIRVMHQARLGDDGVPVVLLHGWPDSVLRFDRVLPLLTDVPVIVPALPGFPFAAQVAAGGMSAAELAEAVAEAMTALGYDRYVVSAGDVGCDVAEALAALHPNRVAALHLTDVSQYHFLADLPDNLSDAERAYVARGRRWQAEEGAYMHEQATRPRTLAVALGDSPAGLAAWLVEKFTRWTDCDGDVENVFTRDELLTWITAYWVGGCVGTSFTPYARAGGPPHGRLDVPTVVTVFPDDLVNAPEEFADRLFTVRSWIELEHGGHFAAWERPEDYVRGVRTALGLARG